MLEVTALSSNTAKACLRACRAIFLIASSPKFAANSSTVDFNSATVLGCFLYTCIITWLKLEKVQQVPNIQVPNSQVPNFFLFSDQICVSSIYITPFIDTFKYHTFHGSHCIYVYIHITRGYSWRLLAYPRPRYITVWDLILCCVYT